MDSKNKKPGWNKYLSGCWHIIVLIILIALFAWQNFYFLENNLAPPYADTTHHLLLAQEYHRFLIVKDFPIMNSPLHQKYPPLIYSVASLYMAALGVSIKSALWSYFTFVIIYMLALYGIGKYFGDKMGGIAVAAIGISNHFIMYMTHMFVPELPQTAMTTLAVYFLLKTERFTDEIYSYFFAVALALAMLTKWSSAFYLLLPILIMLGYYIYKNWKNIFLIITPLIPLSIMAVIYLNAGKELFKINPGGNSPPPHWAIPVFLLVMLVLIALTYITEIFFLKKVDEKQRDNTKYMLIGVRALLIALLICGTWYVYSIQGVVAKLKFQHQEVFQPMQPRNEPLIIFSLKHYIMALTNFPLVYFLLFITGLVFVFIRKQKVLEFIIVLSAIFSGVPLISATAPPAMFYILTCFFVLSVFSGYWFGYAGKLKYPLTILILLLSCISLIYPTLSDHQKESIPIDQSWLDRGLALSDMTEPDMHNYRIEEIINDVDKFADDKNLKTRHNRVPVPVGVYVTDGFRRTRERERSFVEAWVFPCLMRYKGLKGYFPFTMERDWNRRLSEFKGKTLILIIGYLDDDYPEKTVKFLKTGFNREATVLKKYYIDKHRIIAVLVVKPEE